MANLRIYIGDVIRRKTLMQIDFTVGFATEPKVVGSTPAARTILTQVCKAAMILCGFDISNVQAGKSISVVQAGFPPRRNLLL